MNEYRWSDLRVGLCAEFEVVINSEMLEQFAAISGDVNPLHLDDEFARNTPFRQRVVFGMLTSAFYSQLVGVYLPGKWSLLHGIDIDFQAPAYPGDRLTVSGELVHLTEAYHRVDLKARIRNQAGTLISKATIRVGLHGE